MTGILIYPTFFEQLIIYYNIVYYNTVYYYCITLYISHLYNAYRLSLNCIQLKTLNFKKRKRFITGARIFSKLYEYEKKVIFLLLKAFYSCIAVTVSLTHNLRKAWKKFVHPPVLLNIYVFDQ